ncbi:MAG: AbrB/MazE/SpoVT family DNA-binding domain-containing protein [Sphingomonadales bacterium]|nr:AbrB/MazE/SpoVT family DNA-binding domain-containing protein [Sphingomonadales bacterium]
MNDLSNTPKTAKLFWSGRSQAVRLPKEFRFEGAEVTIRREGGRVILEAKDDEDDRAWAERLAGTFDEDFARAVEEGRLGAEHMPEGPGPVFE